VRRSSLHNVAVISAIAVVGLAVGIAGCRQRVGAAGAVSDRDACRTVDSLLASTLPGRPWSLAGRATFDVEEYRVRGRFKLEVNAAGELLLEFSGSTLFGGHREDLVVSLARDTLSVFDREGGRFYQGEEVDDLIRRGTGTGGAWVEGIGRVVGISGCGAVEALERRGTGLAGKFVTGVFRLETDEGRLVRAVWPDPTQAETFDDRLEVTYGWRDGRLCELAATLPVRGWRVRLNGCE
jgi:hypothetical protein